MDQSRAQPEGSSGRLLVVVPAEVAARATGLPVVRDLLVTRFGRFTAAPGHNVRRPRGTAEWVLIGCVAGIGAVEWDDRRWQLGPGDLALLPPGEGHMLESDLMTPWSVVWFHFGGGRAADFAAASGWSRATPVLHVPVPGPLHECLEEARRHARHGLADADLLGLATAFARLLGEVRLRARARDRQARRADDKVLAVLRQLREEPGRRWTIGAMARAAGMSAGHFTELFRLATGSPPLSFLIRLRLQRACEILGCEPAPIQEVAARVGYEDPDHFGRQFRQHFGMAPSRFRAEARGGGR